MPYAVPAPSAASPSPSTSSAPSTPTGAGAATRPHHRRSRSSFTDERGPGAFAPLGALPRRRPSATKKALFHLNVDDSPTEDFDGGDAVASAPPASIRFSSSGGYPPLNSLKFAKETGRFSPSVEPPTHIEMPPMSAPANPNAAFSSSSASVPFPTSSPLPSPSGMPLKFRDSPFIPSPSSASSLPRTPSTPIILSNGKQLKPSLKSSCSSPNIPDMLRTKHLRAQSAPSTPNIHKNVHFAESGLESVRLFNRTGKPSSVSKPPGDETETETEAENSTAERGMSSFPFPSLTGSSSLGLSMSMPSSSSQNIVHEIDPSPHMTSSVPAPSPSPLANVHLETVTLPRTRPPTLRGTVLVRNLAFEKNVAVRFTLDEWQTTSEVACKHVVSLPGLPPPFPKEESQKSDVASRIVSGMGAEEAKVSSWDRFSFTIRLEDYETKLADRTLWLVARYNCPTGEWWDNNSTNNYRVGFRKASIASLSPLGTPVPSAFASPSVNTAKDEKDSGSAKGVVIPSVPQHLLTPVAQQRSFSAPNTLRFTPTTGTLAGIPVVSGSSKTSSPAPLLIRTMSSPYPPSPSFSSSTASGSHATGLQPTPRPASDTARETAAQTSSYIRKRLSLSNYVAPGSSPTEERKDIMAEKQEEKEVVAKGLVTPPTTPPGTVRLRGVGLPPSPPRSPSPPPATEEEEHDEQDGQEEVGEIPSEPEDEDDDTPKDEKSLRLDTFSLPSVALSSSPPKEDLLPFSPTSVKASTATRPFLPFNHGGYLSPPGSRDASEDGSGEGGRGSPASGTPPNESSSSLSSSSSGGRPTHLVLPDLGLSFAHSHLRQPAEFSDEFGDGDETPNGNGSASMDTSDSSYAAFVRQWCFAQSAPPTPGVHTASPTATSTSSSSPRNHQSSASPSTGVKGPKGNPWLGLGMGGVDPSAGYGFPGFNFGAPGQDVGMVGAHMR